MPLKRSAAKFCLHNRLSLAIEEGWAGGHRSVLAIWYCSDPPVEDPLVWSLRHRCLRVASVTSAPVALGSTLNFFYHIMCHPEKAALWSWTVGPSSSAVFCRKPGVRQGFFSYVCLSETLSSGDAQRPSVTQSTCSIPEPLHLGSPDSLFLLEMLFAFSIRVANDFTRIACLHFFKKIDLPLPPCYHLYIIRDTIDSLKENKEKEKGTHCLPVYRASQFNCLKVIFYLRAASVCQL